MKQATFTPSSGSVVEMITFNYEGKFDTIYEYRETENQGLIGNHAIFKTATSQIVDVVCVMLYAQEANAINAQNKIGTLVQREITHTNVRLLKAKRMRGLDVVTTLNVDIINNAYTYVEMMLTFIKEAN